MNTHLKQLNDGWDVMHGLKRTGVSEALKLMDSQHSIAERGHEATADPYLEGWMSALDYAMQLVEKIVEF